jgi:hypothetical protein
MNQNPDASPSVFQMFSEPAMHIYGKGCKETSPVNDDTVHTLAEPLCTIDVHFDCKSTSDSEKKE